MSRAAPRVQCLPCRLPKDRNSGTSCMKVYDGSHETARLPSGDSSAPASLTVSSDFFNEGIQCHDERNGWINVTTVLQASPRTIVHVQYLLVSLGTPLCARQANAKEYSCGANLSFPR